MLRLGRLIMTVSSLCVDGVTSLSCDRYDLIIYLGRLQIYFIQLTAIMFLHIAEAVGYPKVGTT
jgi:hypothetical protein